MATYLGENGSGEAELADLSDLRGDERDGYIDAFGDCCASLAAVIKTLEYLEPAESIRTSNDIVYSLCMVASTVGYPIVPRLGRDLIG